MNCCGKKRTAFLEEKRVPTAEENLPPENDLGPEESKQILLEYTGNHSLQFTGVYSGQEYLFPRHGSRLTVLLKDAYPLMAERDFRIVREQA